jgi:hypothetical protein
MVSQPASIFNWNHASECFLMTTTTQKGMTPMGWTTCQEAPSDMDAWMKKELGWTAQDGSQKNTVLDTAVVALTELYAAVETRHADGRREVWAAVFQIKFMRRSDDGRSRNFDGCKFGYKDQSEHMGPGQTRCPTRILDLLTPTDHEYAVQWRNSCRTYHERQKLNKLENDEIIRFAEPLRFRNIDEPYDTFRIAKKGNSVKFVALDTQYGHSAFHCSIPGYKDRQFERIAPDAVIKVDPGAAPRLI